MTFPFYTSHQSIIISRNQICAHWNWNFFPFFLAIFPKFGLIFRLALNHRTLKVLPQVLNWIKVWVHGWPTQYLNPIASEIFFRLAACMLGVIVLVKICDQSRSKTKLSNKPVEKSNAGLAWAFVRMGLNNPPGFWHRHAGPFCRRFYTGNE